MLFFRVLLSDMSMDPLPQHDTWPGSSEYLDSQQTGMPHRLLFSASPPCTTTLLDRRWVFDVAGDAARGEYEDLFAPRFVL